MLSRGSKWVQQSFAISARDNTKLPASTSKGMANSGKSQSGDFHSSIIDVSSAISASPSSSTLSVSGPISLFPTSRDRFSGVSETCFTEDAADESGSDDDLLKDDETFERGGDDRGFGFEEEVFTPGEEDVSFWENEGTDSSEWKDRRPFEEAADLLLDEEAADLLSDEEDADLLSDEEDAHDGEDAEDEDFKDVVDEDGGGDQDVPHDGTVGAEFKGDEDAEEELK